MNEVKPIDWDSLPKVWAWITDNGNVIGLQQAVFLEKIDGYYRCLVDTQSIVCFEYISITDPRQKQKPPSI